MLVRGIVINTLFLMASSLAINAVIASASYACPKLPDTISTTIIDGCLLSDNEGIEITETGKIEDGEIAVGGNATSIINAGTITSGNWAIWIKNGGNLSDGIVNTGAISGEAVGILFMNDGDFSGSGVNSGIVSGEYGIAVDDGSDVSGDIRNLSDGEIKGGDDGITVICKLSDAMYM